MTWRKNSMWFCADHKKIAKSLITEFTEQKNWKIIGYYRIFFFLQSCFKYSNTGFKIRILVLKYSIVQTFKLLNFQTSCNPVKFCKIEIQQHYKIFFTEFQFYRILQDYRTFGSPGLYWILKLVFEYLKYLYKHTMTWINKKW